MPDYGFYTECYLGNRIPQQAFGAAVGRARDHLAQLQRVFRVVSAGQQATNMALCAMAEVLYDAHRRSGIRSAGVGDVTVQYQQEDGALEGKLLRCAGVYLDIYRGVDGWSK